MSGFTETDHPRDNSGRFTSGSGDHAETAAKYKEFAAINEYLRGDKSASSGSASENAKMKTAMDAMLRDHKTTKSITVYRGFGAVNVETLIKAGVLRDKAYVSTTRNEETAREFAEDGYIAKIDVPEGSSAYDYGEDDHQGETVLPRGSKFKVVGVNHLTKTFHLKLVI